MSTSKVGLGRPVKLVYYDDQSNSATVPALYQKLLDVDKVDIVIGGSGTNLLAPAMPVVIQKKKMLIGLFEMAEFNYPRAQNSIRSRSLLSDTYRRSWD